MILKYKSQPTHDGVVFEKEEKLQTSVEVSNLDQISNLKKFSYPHKFQLY